MSNRLTSAFLLLVALLLCLPSAVRGVALSQPESAVPEIFSDLGDSAREIGSSNPRTLTGYESWGQEVALDVNIYAYCHNDPVNKVDYLGLQELHTDAIQSVDIYARIKWLDAWMGANESVYRRGPSGEIMLAVGENGATAMEYYHERQFLRNVLDARAEIERRENGYQADVGMRNILDNYFGPNSYRDKPLLRDWFRGEKVPANLQLNNDMYPGAYKAFRTGMVNTAYLMAIETSTAMLPGVGLIGGQGSHVSRLTLADDFVEQGRAFGNFHPTPPTPRVANGVPISPGDPSLMFFRGGPLLAPLDELGSVGAGASVSGKELKPVLLGTFQPRVNAAAGTRFNTWPARNWEKWKEAGTEWSKNRRWLMDQITSGRPVYSIADDPVHGTGPYFAKEAALLRSQGFRKTYAGTIDIDGFGTVNLYKWVK